MKQVVNEKAACQAGQVASHRQNVPPGAFARTKSVDVTPSFSLQNLAPGEYVLTLDVTINRRVTTRHVRFTVTPSAQSGRVRYASRPTGLVTEGLHLPNEPP